MHFLAYSAILYSFESAHKVPSHAEDRRREVKFQIERKFVTSKKSYRGGIIILGLIFTRHKILPREESETLIGARKKLLESQISILKKSSAATG